MKILAVDPGEKRIGLALSDPTGQLANPLGILIHHSRTIDSAHIIQICQEHQVDLIIIGQALQSDGQVGARARSSLRLEAEINQLSSIPTLLWDESHTTQFATSVQIHSGLSKKKRQKPKDHLAAALLLQDFLDSNTFKTIQYPDESQ